MLSGYVTLQWAIEASIQVMLLGDDYRPTRLYNLEKAFEIL